MFTPPFCPNYLCRHHQSPRTTHWYYHIGSYHTKAFGTVPRFKCLSCGKSFSTQTFMLDYYVKRPLDYLEIFKYICSTSGIRSTARWLAVSHQAIINRISRMARQAMAIHAELLASLQLNEDLVTDGFESFVADQYQPNNIHLLTGSSSQFFYAFDFAHLRRKGRMTEHQKLEREQREQHYIRKRITITESFQRLMVELEHLIQRRSTPHTTLYSDMKKEYQQVIKHSLLLTELSSEESFSHVTVSSRKARTTTNPLFPVNYIDRLLRKDSANHVRETMQFSQNVNNCLERLTVFQLYHNYFKPFRVDDPEKRKLCHAQMAGISRTRIEKCLKGVFTYRRFFTRVKLSFFQLMVWARMVGSLHRMNGGYWPQYIWM